VLHTAHSTCKTHRPGAVFDNLEIGHSGENQLSLKKDTQVNFLKN